MAEELLVRNEPGHGDQTPATDRLKTRVDGIQIRHAVGGVHQRQPVTKLAARIRLQELRLPRIEPTPQRVILVAVDVIALRDTEVESGRAWGREREWQSV